MRTKRAMSASLPPLRCTPELREQVTKVAAEQGKSIGEVQRHAIELFLSGFHTDRMKPIHDRLEQAS